jgi:hypothetical protein
MLLPLPTIIGWFLAVQLHGRFPEFSVERVNDLARWIGLSFLALALTVTLFVRLRQRWLKVAVLFISGLLTLVMTACYAGGRVGLPTFLTLIVVLSGLFLTPAILERKIRHNRQQPTT